MRLGQGFRLICQISRRADIRRQIAKVLGQTDTGTDRLPLFQSGFCRFDVCTADDIDRQLFDAFGLIRFFILGSLALHAIELVDGIQHYLGMLRHTPGNIMLFDSEVGQKTNGIRSAATVDGLDRSLDCLPVMLFVQLALLAETNQQYAFAQQSGNGMQQQRRTRLAIQVAAFEHCAQVAA